MKRHLFNVTSAIALAAVIAGTPVHADSLSPLIPEATLKQIAEEVSGVTAKRSLDEITLYHRTRASAQFDKAGEVVIRKLQSYGFETVDIFSLPADGKSMYGTQKSRPAWNVSFAELWEVTEDGTRIRKLGDWEARPLTLAQDSDSADVTAELVDIGRGVTEDDYAGKDIKGKIVLTSSQPGAVEALALRKYGAAGILSYAANQKSAWWQLDDSLVRWGHLSSFRDEPAFAFMTSLGEARALQVRLAKGESIRFHAKVDAVREEGEYRIVTATIPGSDPKLADEEITFSCHLDHPRPGANDNASGCVSILEAARTLKRLTDSGALPAPKRTIRFLWPSEIEATLILLNAYPELGERTKHVIHMDMVGGGPETKAVFRVSRGPKSTADVSGDIAWAITDFVNEHTLAFASGEDTAFPLFSPEGGREPLLAQHEWLDMGSDHDVFAAGSWGIPVTYMHDWPDRYIHTTKDVAANIDPTKLKRAAFIGAVQAAVLANLDDDDAGALLALERPAAVARLAEVMSEWSNHSAETQAEARLGHWLTELRITRSIKGYAPKADTTPLTEFTAAVMALEGAQASNTPQGTVYRRNPDLKGTMNGFGYSYIADKLGAEKLAALKLPNGLRGHEMAYEALNYVDGSRSVREIYTMLVAEFYAVDRAALEEYLQALASIDVLSAK
ncbi:M28 family peptidase [Kordiimonas gwangyangensis]|uniref:M28 family peptidase n=2 Tax=Kordiimonas gwangyangensis TaxID=288022 RepID=UPI000371659F|nr:M28 family peptidase [Kordiimonas gwangyangensis]